MPKKIYDIFPPNLNKEKEKGVIEKMVSLNSKSFSFFKGVVVFSPILFILIGFFLYFKLPRANLDIWIKTELVSLKAEVKVNKEVNEIDILNKIIPGKIMEEEKESWQEFESTGTIFEEEKAKGVLRVFNKNTPPTPVSLKAGTRFLSDSGKYFVSSEKIYISPNSYVDIKVTALESGEDYNIGPAKFSIPGLFGTAYYYNTYGESAFSMKGGFKKESKQVTEGDISKARDFLAEKVLVDLENSLKKKISPEIVLLDSSILKEVVEASSLVKSGTVMPKFNFQLKGRVKTLVFKKSDLDNLAKKLILAGNSDSKKIFEESLKIDYRSKVADIREGRGFLILEISAKIYPVINEREIFNLIKGRNDKEIKEKIIGELSDKISRVNVNFWPFWVKKAPNNINQVKINLNLE